MYWLIRVTSVWGKVVGRERIELFPNRTAAIAAGRRLKEADSSSDLFIGSHFIGYSSTYVVRKSRLPGSSVPDSQGALPLGEVPF